MYNSRGTSTKTRIETDNRFAMLLSEVIQEAHPLKQGLKLEGRLFVFATPYHSRGTSTKTRIETGHIPCNFAILNLFKRHIH